MIRVFIPLFAIVIFVRYYFASSPTLRPIDGYPVWLRDSAENQTLQTSGFSYVGMKEGRKVFISCDDIGKVHRIEIDESGSSPKVMIFPVEYSEEVKTLFAKFKKTDMEEIMYDADNNRILLSIEGHEYSSNDPMIYRKKEGIYEIEFNKDILTFDTLLTITRLKLPEEVYAHTHDNVGFEGFSATKDYFYLGLENFQKENDQFTDSTYIYIVDRKSGALTTISTRELKISSVCGLFAKSDKIIYGVDRNMRQLFRIELDDKFGVRSVERKLMELSLPDHPEMTNPGIAPESITFDDKDDIYVAIDPWLAFYRPDLAQRRLLSEEDLFNFRKEVPLLYKFKDELK